MAVLIAMFMTACSGFGDDPVLEGTPPTSVAGETTSDPSENSNEAGDETEDEDIGLDGVSAAGDPSEPDDSSDAERETAEPARRLPSQQSDETSHWVGHGVMSNDAIEVAWSEVEGANVTYQIFRFDSVGTDPEAVELEIPIHEGVDSLGWTDDSVETGKFYTYVMRVIADDEVLERRWTDTLAVTDQTPPSDITGLTASVTDGEVLLAWDEGSDDVEFGSYGVFRTDVADEAQYIGGGADVGVTSFIDNDIPDSGEIGYEVVAFDFHGNRSSPVSITVELP